jgi:hypothetical protein
VILSLIYFAMQVVMAGVALGIWGDENRTSFLWMPYAYWFIDKSVKGIFVRHPRICE